MTTHTTESRCARRLQQITFDEIGKKPPLQRCYNLIVKHWGLKSGKRTEEFACLVYSLERETLTELASKRERMRTHEETTKALLSSFKNDENVRMAYAALGLPGPERLADSVEERVHLWTRLARSLGRDIDRID